jgi:hypothetical protein
MTDKLVSIVEHGNLTKQWDAGVNPHAVDVDKINQASLVFTGNLFAGSVSFGLDSKAALITIYGEGNEELVIWHRDGTATIKHADRLNEAAKTFVKGVALAIKADMPPQPYVVRQRGVNMFLNFKGSEEGWDTSPENAVQFARMVDADGIVAGNPDLEVVLLDQAMVF